MFYDDPRIGMHQCDLHKAEGEEGDQWITINGAHLLIGGQGEAKAGPSALVSTYNQSRHGNADRIAQQSIKDHGKGEKLREHLRNMERNKLTTAHAMMRSGTSAESQHLRNAIARERDDRAQRGQ